MRAFLTVFGIRSRDERIEKVAAYACQLGYAVLPLRPGSKIPACTLTDREKAREQKAGTRHDCGVHEAITDPKVALRVVGRMSRASGQPLNLGVVAYPSRLVVVDADTEGACSAFLADLAASEDDQGYLDHSPTVRTPGARNAEGDWVHRNGGHYYFTVPDGVELEVGRGVIRAPGGYEVRWGWSMTAVPPSVRPEGPYEPTGDIQDLPRFLHELIAADNARVVERRALHGAWMVNDEIAAWSLSVTWAELLIPDGWTDTSKIDACGCPIFEKPGGGSTTFKSATGHDQDCTKYENFEGHGPLHLWTTDPPPPLDDWIAVNGQTLTRLQYVALTKFEGDVDAAKVGLGITPAVLDWVASMPEAAQDKSPGQPMSSYPEPLREPGHEDMGKSEAPADPLGAFFRPDETDAFRDRVKARAREDQIRSRADELRGFLIGGPAVRMTVKSVTTITAKPPRPTIGHRTDGVPLLYPGRVSTIWGPSDSGKSWFSLACAIDTVTRGGRALVIDTEDDEAGFHYRAELLGAVHPELRYVRLWAVPDMTEAEQLLVEARAADLVVVDSLDGFLALYLVDSNAATAVRTAGATMKRWAQAGDAAVLVVDHSTEKVGPGERSNTAMGSSAKKHLIDGVMLRADRETRWGPMRECRTMVMVGKDRHAGSDVHAEFDPADVEGRWGRAARLVMTPGLEGSVLSLIPPPSYQLEPIHRPVTADRVLVEDRIIEYLAKTPGEWQSKTSTLAAAGDKNATHGEDVVLTDLVKEGLVEELEDDHPTVKGRRRTRYRIAPIEEGTP